MEATSGENVVHSRSELGALAGPYSLRPLLSNIELETDGKPTGTVITCVEYWEGNLYIGTSAGELLHFVSLPGEDATQESTFILASRLEPTPSDRPSGVKQILILANSNKACILCNGVVTFHMLPELSPASGHGKPTNVVWMGAQDMDMLGQDEGNEDFLMIAMRNKLRLVKTIREQKPQLLNDIEFPGCLTAERRSRFACVADGENYALLDLENRQKVPLFPISSTNRTSSTLGQRQTLPDAAPHSRSVSTQGQRPGTGSTQSHSRAASLGNLVGNISKQSGASRSRSRDTRQPRDLDEGSRDTGTLSPPAQSSRGTSPAPSAETPDKPLPAPPQEQATVSKISPQESPPQQLSPHILSPSPTEFLLTTGTAPLDRGVGVFVNCDGDVVRGTLEFAQYPTALVVDGGHALPLQSISQFENEAEGYVLAAMGKPSHDQQSYPVLEIQRWNAVGESKAWLQLSSTSVPEQDTDIPMTQRQHSYGIVRTRSTVELGFNSVIELLHLRRFQFRDSTRNGAEAQAVPIVSQQDKKRNQQEDEFASRFGQVTGNIVAWSNNQLHWAVRNPLVVKLSASVDLLLRASEDSPLDQSKLLKQLANIRNKEAKSEAEFLGLDFIRQKICLVLFGDLAVNQVDVNPQIDGNLLTEGGTDPRIMLSMVPLLRDDIFEAPGGMWIHDGLNQLLQTRLATTSVILDADEVLARPSEFDILTLIKQYLHAWRQKKGFGSIADETQVFQTVDAALLHVLLHQDQQLSSGPGSSPSLRAELYSVVDEKIDCFDRAVELLEEYKRLYVLSRLYQSRKNRSLVLATWRRILDGERDAGGEFTNGELQIPQYLAKIREAPLFEEYATWLAKRNPKLGIQVFTEDKSKVKLPPSKVVGLLRERAPDAVKDYLEHLVFGKKNVQYANELISFYLDNVLGVLESSAEARETLAQSYSAYRALEAPRPTYRQFISDNASSESWWTDRLRLLELLGGSHGAGFSYDVERVLKRIEPFEESLVPESIILDGRQGRHEQALRLLTHGLGDYHTAINYCLLGGSSIFHPTSGGVDGHELPSREEQSALFRYLLSEFLKIEDADSSVERTSELLGRFCSWFDTEHVLAQIPDTWSVETMSAFLTTTFRRIVQEKNESSIAKALSGVENLRISAEFMEKCEKLGPHVIPATDTPTSMT